MVSISDCHMIRHRDGGWRGVVSISDCHIIRHRDGGWRGVVSISDCHIIRHRDGGGGVWFLSPTVTLLDIEMGMEGCGFYLRLSHD